MSQSEYIVSKRQRSPSLDRTLDRSAVKRQREDKHPHRWTPSERFWDTLPQIHLTSRALAEHNRRNRQHQLQQYTSVETKPPPRRRSTRLRRRARQKELPLPRCTDYGKADLDLQRFARGGGPDLTSLRGCPDPTMSIQDSQSCTPLSKSKATTSSKRSNPYDANYEAKLVGAGVCLTEEMDENDNFVMPNNHEDIMTRLDVPRPSLSPSRFTEMDFQAFRRQSQRATSEIATMQRVISTIEGSSGHFFSLGDQPFNNLEPFDLDIADAKPDQYDGALPQPIDRRVLDALGRYIIPSTNMNRPAAPNFFLEVKGPRGRTDVARLQAAHCGAIGARGMTWIQSYPSETPQYNGNAYSFTNTYQDGILRLYATRATAPKPDNNDDRPQYHMTQLRVFGMTDSSKSFREGATQYRNARDLAKEQRDSFIQHANQAAQQMPAGKRGKSSRTTTSRRSSTRTDSQSRRRRSDTSADELALEGPVKRSRTGL